MNKYLQSVIENVRVKHANEPEFVQTIEEVLSSLDVVVEKHPEYEKYDLISRLVEPERQFTFRVVWEDDNGNYHTNTEYIDTPEIPFCIAYNNGRFWPPIAWSKFEPLKQGGD